MKILFPVGRIALVASALILGAVTAHAESFDARKFFDKLAAEGASMPVGFDAKTFFDKLAAEGASDKRPIDARAFFDKLASEGASMPVGFDSKEVFRQAASRRRLLDAAYGGCEKVSTKAPATTAVQAA